MKSRIVRFGVLIASVMGLLLTMTPAEATWVKTVTFTGTATLTGCPGVGTPVLFGVPEVTTETKPTNGVVNVTVHNGNTCDFTLASTACVKASVGKKNGVDLCTISATGTVTGFCGLSSGTGTAVITNETGTVQPKPDVVVNFKFSSTGTTLRVSNSGAGDTVAGDVSVLPVTGSCAAKSATGFLASGEVVIVHQN